MLLPADNTDDRAAHADDDDDDDDDDGNDDGRGIEARYTAKQPARRAIFVPHAPPTGLWRYPCLGSNCSLQ